MDEAAVRSIEDLNPMIPLVANKKGIFIIHGNANRIVEESILPPSNSEGPQESSFAIKDLNAVVPIRNENLSRARDGGRQRGVKLPIAQAIASKLSNHFEAILDIQDLHPVVGRVADQKAPVLSEAQAFWERELAGATPFASNALKEGQLASPWIKVQHLQTMVEQIRDNDLVLPICHDTAGRIKMVWTQSLRAMSSQHLLCHRVEDLNSMIALVHNEKVSPSMIKGNSTWMVNTPNAIWNMRFSRAA
mmetsp:Transcript_38922/g.48188  ORF Transcript_38922/g.48188 Transcript_38922/m.48188 type:complete len:248 (+) Transcript_38922:147-890(+)